MAALPTAGVSGIFCTVCQEILLHPHPWRCTFGHYMCDRCFGQFIPIDISRCAACYMHTFTREDFPIQEIQKLDDIIGRTITSIGGAEETIHRSTLEELFFLPYEAIDKIIKEKYQYQTREQNDKKLRNIKDPGDVAGPSCIIALLDKNTTINCPDSSCSQTITSSSARSHYKTQINHICLKFYNYQKGAKLLLNIDLSNLRQGETKCLGIIEFHQHNTEKKTEDVQIFSLSTFWIMLSDVPSISFSNSYILVWLFSDNEEEYFCNLKLFQEDKMTSVEAWCLVNKLQDTQDIEAIFVRRACLYVRYSDFWKMNKAGRINLEVIIP